MLDLKRFKFLQFTKNKSRDESFKIVKEEKFKMGLKEFCGESKSESRAFHISEFVDEILNYEFSEMPNYDKLRFLLEKVLLQHNIVPSSNFDWMSKDYQNKLLKVASPLPRQKLIYVGNDY